LRAHFVLNQSLAAAVNHLLGAESWARDRLRPHAGKTAVLRVAPLTFSFSIADTGLTVAVDAPQEPALEIRLAPSSLAGALRGEDSALKDADIRGDAELASAVLFLVKNLRWEFEEDLSALVGDIVAHRMVSDAKGLVAWEREARGRLAASVSDYLTREAAVLATSAEIGAFAGDVDKLRDDAARLEKRLARIVGAAGKNSG
jgi:ubiquinone biosynthesis protein UbiJ